MCNLYTTRKSAAEIAAYLEASMPHTFNAPQETYPGTPGMVVVEREGLRELRSMAWGFPLLTADMKARGSKPKPVNNVADLTKPMWRGIAAKQQWRCLIPLTAFAEAEGPKGAKTRTWFSVKGQPIFAWAGFWRKSAEWGDVYTGLVTDCNEAIRPVHNRMPVLLHGEEHERWLCGSVEDVIAIRSRCFPDELIVMEQTSDPWVRRARSPNQDDVL